MNISSPWACQTVVLCGCEGAQVEGEAQLPGEVPMSTALRLCQYSRHHNKLAACCGLGWIIN